MAKRAATTVEIYKAKGGKHRWRAKARNGEVIGSGQAYKRRSDAKRGGQRAFPAATVVVK